MHLVARNQFEPRSVFGRDRGLAPLQLELAFWPRGSLKEALDAHLRHLPALADDTLVDYRTRSAWLLAAMGESTSLASISLETLELVAAEWGPKGKGLMWTTIKKRFTFLLAAMKYAVGRKILRRDDVPPMPALPDDSNRGKRALPLAEFRELRMATIDQFRRFADVSYWTGFHTRDVQRVTCDWFDPHYVWRDEATGEELWRGRYLRRNHKNTHCEDVWLPMEPELREAAIEWWRNASPASLVVGHVWNLSRTFHAACDRANIARVKPNQDLRRSFASMLAARGWSTEYVRVAQGHEGSPQFDDAGTFQGARKPTMDTRHYLRPTMDFLVGELRRRIGK